VITILLTIVERNILMSILPKEGNFITLKTVRQLREALSIQDGEDEEYGIMKEGDSLGNGAVVPKGQFRMTRNLDVEKEIPFSKKGLEVAETALKALDAQNKLTEAHVSLYEKFVGE